MGNLIYGSPGVEVQFDDRTLTHLRLVILAKLRREEKFALTWDDAESGNTLTLWLHPAIPLRFEISTHPPVAVNGAWIEALTAASNSGTGLRMMQEPSAAPR